MAQTDRSRTWDVLLVGGASGTGKSTVVSQLAQHFGVGVVAVDDLHLAVEAMTTPDQQPEFHFWRTKPDSLVMTAAAIVELHRSVARVLEPALRAVIADHVEFRNPMILEGDYLLPELLDDGGLPAEQTGRMRALFLHEPDAAQIVDNFLQREPAGGGQTERAEVSRMLGESLQKDCAERAIPVLNPRPFPTLAARMIAALD